MLGRELVQIRGEEVEEVERRGGLLQLGLVEEEEGEKGQETGLSGGVAGPGERHRVQGEQGH